MGGMGSGSWYRFKSKKTQVEECLTLNIFHLNQQSLLYPSEGVLTWSRSSTGEKTASVGYSVKDEGNGFLSLTLKFTLCRNSQSTHVEEPILLVPSKPNFGGTRYWFKCPLVLNGHSCPRMVGKLHLPHGHRYFGCRHCHNLTYASRQEHNKRLDVFARLFRESF